MPGFACTSCGRCCHGLRLTLAIDEALAWIDRGGVVEILCDALPAAADFTPSDLAEYRARAFVVTSGTLDLVVGLILVATFAGACPNLQPDMRCGIYAERPNICRIYPAEIVPGRAPDPADKRCPPEAWSLKLPPILDAKGSIADAVTREAITGARTASRAETASKARLAALLGIDTAALRHEGFTAFRRDAAELRSALLACRSPTDDPRDDGRWNIVTGSARTRDMIADAGAIAAAPASTTRDYYIGLA